MMDVMILAAGEGRRLAPFTETLPKALVPVRGEPMIDHLIRRLVKQGCSRFVVNLYHFGDQLRRHLEESVPDPVTVVFSDERNMLLDTGGAIKYALPLITPGTPFMVHNVDIWTNLQPGNLLACHRLAGAVATLAVRSRESSRQLLFDQRLHLCGWRNSATGELRMARQACGDLTPMAFSGVQIMDPEIEAFFPETDRFSMVDLYLAAAEKGAVIKAFPHDSDLWFDLGTPQRIANFEKSM